ncbi:MAG: nucleotidyltransferase family protein [Firmicutes bacterium]|nr:nucleotidyltransferase family protein [Bacillota bacterium]MBQ6239370.1 nucleotidyltransferase family protein [Bacillota bacterium]
MDLDAVYQLAEWHTLTAAAGMALESAGVRTEKFTKGILLAQRKVALLDNDRNQILSAMEEAGIWYMPLKGVILKELYPRFGMRQMVDNDILFDRNRAEDLRRIMVGLGFTVKKYGHGANDVYQKPPVSSFEMHRYLFYELKRKESLENYYKDVESRLLNVPGRQYEKCFSKEDFYLYITSHEYKHFSGGGTGLRSFLDIYVYLNKETLDMDYIRKEAKKLQIADFEEMNREFSLKLFEEKELMPEEEKLLEFICSSGTYGTVVNRVKRSVKEKGKLGYFFYRLFPPYDYMKRAYPVLKKIPGLLPFLWIYRLFGRLLSASGKKKAITEMKVLKKRDNP